jgi:tetratricopeptide (TPR) repeat protein
MRIAWLAIRLVHVLAVIAALTAPVRADESDEAKAKQAYERGRKYQELDEHDKAIEQYLRAYEYSKHPQMLFNVAQVYLIKGDKVMAREYYEKYVRLEPHGPGSAVARKRIAELSAELERERQLRPQPAPVVPAETPPSSNGNATSPSTASGSAVAPASTAPNVNVNNVNNVNVTVPPTTVLIEREETSSGGWSITSLLAGGAGIIALGVAAKFGLDAKSASDKVADRWDPKLYTEGQDAEKAMFLWMGIGTAAIATGSVIYYLSARAEDGKGSEDALTIAPNVGNSSVMLFVHGGF